MPRARFWFFATTGVLLITALWLWQHWHKPIHIVTSINPKDGAVMVWVPSGTFIRGKPIAEQLREVISLRDWKEIITIVNGKHVGESTPARRIYLDGYWIYQHEVTVKQYRLFCKASGRKMPPPPVWGWHESHPITNVTWYEAQAYAKWADAQLPTEAQWEKAARGIDGRKYPWGNIWDMSRCNNPATRVKRTTPVGTYLTGVSPYGAEDMAGNVSEWCMDWHDPSYYSHAPSRNPRGPATGRVRVLRGGSWEYILSDGPCISRDGNSPSGRDANMIGFRCVSLSRRYAK